MAPEREISSDAMLVELVRRGDLIEVCRCLCEKRHHDTTGYGMCHVCWDGHPYQPVFRRTGADMRTSVDMQLEHIKLLLNLLLQPGILIAENAHAPGEWYALHNTPGGGIAKVDLPNDLVDILNSAEGQSWAR